MQQQEEKLSIDDAGSDLYERYSTPIFAYLRLRAPSLEDTEDVLIEVFTAALEQDNLSWLNEKQRFIWLRRVAQKWMPSSPNLSELLMAHNK